MAATQSDMHPSSSINSNTIDLYPSTNEAPGQTSLGLPSQRASNGPLPLPSFVFPARATPTSAPSSFSRATGRRPLSVIEVTRGMAMRPGEGVGDDARTPDLPPFSFGTPTSSAPSSPRHRNIPPRPGLHQRGTSEFIGGDGTNASSNGLMSTSPTKGDGVLPPPTGFGPPGGRRGHRHVRSAAISGHDLSMIIKPQTSPVTVRGNSAPCSPSGERERPHSAFPGLANSTIKYMEGGIDLTLAADSGTNTEGTPPRGLNRTRVGFSDNVEFIPRPLSLISDSSSTVTARQGHSVSNSMSSIVSAGTSSPPAKDKRGMPPNNRRIMDSRPRTAEPILDRESKETDDSPQRRNSVPFLVDSATTSTSAPSTPRSAKKWTFFGHDSNSGDRSPKSRPTSAGSIGKECRPTQPEPLPDPAIAVPGLPIQSIEISSSRRSSISRKPSKKQKKVRTWAGSILSRKTRQRSQKQKLSRRSPTPPHRSYASMEDPSNASNVEGNQAEQPAPKQDPDNNITSWKPRKMPTLDDAMSPMIDLDAALGPFNTPSSFGDDWEISQKGSTKKRAMHSAAGLGGFAGPGMHYHRRAESAPEFENPRFGLHRLGSSSTMAMDDVFEEEEEDEWEDAKASSDKEDSGNTLEDDNVTGSKIDIRIEDVEDASADSDAYVGQDDLSSLNHGIKRKGSGLSEGDRRTVSTAKSVHSATSVIDEPIMEESTDPVEIIDDSTSSRPESRAQSSDSTATPPFRSEQRKELDPVHIQPFTLHPPYPTPTSPRSTTHSSLPSPRSPFSYDTQRISTASSSVTDEQGFQSLLLGEPGPEVRYSVDDVPSLTSSNSTMTRDSGHPAANNPQFRDGQRSASLSSAAVSRKRSSMASLSRLISSSHGEKSKLSIESRPPTSGDMERKDKGSKSKRISRMMQFWKPKESSS